MTSSHGEFLEESSQPLWGTAGSLEFRGRWGVRGHRPAHAIAFSESTRRPDRPFP